MAFMFNAQRQNMSISSRARTEAFAGLLLLLFAVTVLAFNRCGPINFSSFSSLTSCSSTEPRPFSKSLESYGIKSSDNSNIIYGNAWHDGKHTSGWWVGHFIETPLLRHVTGVETKWAIHKAGKRHDGFSENSVATSMAILISGRHRLEFANGAHVILEYPGDYVIWGPHIPHSWTALSDTTMLCVRWPSLPHDQTSVLNVTAGSVRSMNDTHNGKDNHVRLITTEINSQSDLGNSSDDSFHKSINDTLKHNNMNKSSSSSSEIGIVHRNLGNNKGNINNVTNSNGNASNESIATHSELSHSSTIINTDNSGLMTPDSRE